MQRNKIWSGIRAGITGLATVMAAATLGVTSGGAAQAQIIVTNTFTGQIGLTTDGLGTTTGSGVISSEIPLNSTIVGAYLFAQQAGNGLWAASPTITFAGTSLSNAVLLSGGESALFDVTSIVQSNYNAGTVLQNFNLVENTPLEGSALAVVYSNPTLATSTVILAGGGVKGLNNTVSLSLPATIVSTTNATMALGIDYSIDNSANQRSEIRVNGTLLSSGAGGNDDGILSNGALVTVGGVGDNVANPTDPLLATSSRANDDELYSIGSLLTVGSSNITINYNNISQDDRLFFVGLQYQSTEVNAAAAPEPGSIALLLTAGVPVIGIVRRRAKKLA